MTEKSVTVRLAQAHDYQFDVTFGEALPVLRADEPPPLGQGQGPSPVQLLAAAVGNCLCDSLLFAIRKYKQSPEPIRADVLAEVGRNAEGRLRVQQIQVTLTLGVPGADIDHLERALSTFEQFCTVTQSLAAAIPVRVQVLDASGTVLKG